MINELAYIKTKIGVLKARMKPLIFKKINDGEMRELNWLREELETEYDKCDALVCESAKNYQKFRGQVTSGVLPYFHQELPETIQELYSKVACYLTGRDIQVRFQTPHLKEIKGVFMPLKGGGGIIDISPGMTPHEHYWYFLHELAHARLHYTPVKNYNPAVDYKPSTVELTQAERTSEVTQTHEDEANTKAENWNKWAKARSGEELWRFGEGCSPEIPKLFALLEMEVYYD